MKSCLYFTCFVRPTQRVIFAWVVVLVGSFLATTPVFSQTGRFLDAPQYPTAGYVQGIVVADFNADGIADIATCGTGASRDTVSILLGNSDGTFQAHRDFNTGTGPNGIAVGDFNGDGNLDIVTADFGIDQGFSNTVSVLLGNGDGTFQRHVEYEAGNFPKSVAVGDFNGDGKLDIVVTNYQINLKTVSVLLGNGDGTFGSPVAYGTGELPTSVVVGDFNDDGELDIAVANSGENTVSVLLGNGDGTFQTHQDFATGRAPNSLIVADFNGDLKSDLATANSGGNTVSVLLGRGDGTFRHHIDTRTPNPPTYVAAGDLNGDNKPDLVAFDKGVSVLLGTGDGHFQTSLNYGLYSFAGGIVIGEFNGDGHADVAVGHSFGVPQVGILLGNGDGTLQGRADYTTEPIPTAVAAGDLNGDGRADVAVTSSYANTVSVFLSNGDGGFSAGVNYATGANPSDVAIGDVNGDGKADLVVGNLGGNSISVLLGNGDGTFQPAREFGAGGPALAVTIGDFNGDGKKDIAVANNMSPGTVSILLGNGDGTFPTHTEVATGAYPGSVATSDLNGDGNADLVVSYSNTMGFEPNEVSVLLGNGDGTFQPHVDYSTGNDPGDPVSVKIGDLNGDGKKDLVVAKLFSAKISVFLGTGDGTFQPHVDYSTAVLPAWVALGDFNVDGKLDVVTANGWNVQGYTISLLLGNGDGTFRPHVEFQTGTTPVSVSAGDFNADGALDLAVANQFDGTVSILLNSGGVSVTLASSQNPSHLGQNVTFTATVAPSFAVGTPSGTVTFLDGNMMLGTGTLTEGQATFTTSSLAGGRHRISGSYSGDITFNHTKSEPLIQKVRR